VIEWLNANAGAVQGFAVVALVMITAFYAWQTTRLAQETKRMADAAREQAEASGKTVVEMQRAQQPVVDIRVESLRGSGQVYEGLQTDNGILPQTVTVHLKNIGAGPAIDAEANIDHPSRAFGAISRWRSSEIRASDFTSLEPHSEATFSFSDPMDQGRGTPSPGTPALFWSEYTDVYGKRWRSQRAYSFAPGSYGLVAGSLHIIAEGEA